MSNCNCEHSFSTNRPSYWEDCLCEFPLSMPACLRKQKPDCAVRAIIPIVTLDTADGIDKLANCFVQVTSNNTVYYVDDKHRLILVWAGPVEIASYDISTNPNNLRSQDCYTYINNIYTHVHFDKQGVGHVMSRELS